MKGIYEIRRQFRTLERALSRAELDSVIRTWGLDDVLHVIGPIEGPGSLQLRGGIAAWEEASDRMDAKVHLIEPVIRKYRPALVWSDLDRGPDDDAPPLVEEVFTKKARLQELGRSVGRMSYCLSGMEEFATCWVVDVGRDGTWLLTAAHVAARVELAGGATVTFPDEGVTSVEAPFAMGHGDEDVALFRARSDIGRTALTIAPQRAQEGAWFCVLGYPFERGDLFPPDRWAVDVFHPLYGVLRVSPGYRLPPDRVFEETYDASTTVGYSGGPVLDLSDTCVVGLHLGQMFAEKAYLRNRALDGPSLRCWLRRVAP